MKEEKEIDKIFNDTVEGFEMTPSDTVWEKLNDRLDRKAETRYKPIAFRLLVALISMVTLFIGFVIYHFNFTSDKISSENTVLENQKTEKVALNNNKSKTEEQNVSANLKSENKSGNVSIKNNTVLYDKESQVLLNDKATAKSKTNESLVNNNFVASLNLTRTKNHQLVLNEQVKNEPYNEFFKKDVVKNNERVNMVDSNLFSLANTIENQDSLLVVIEPVDLIQKTDSISTQLVLPTEKVKATNNLLSKLSVLAYFSPDLNYKYFRNKSTKVKNSSNAASNSNNSNNSNNNNSNNSEENDDEYEDYNDTEEAAFSFNSGVLFGLDLSKHWVIKTGISYAYLAQSIQPKSAIAKTNIDGSTDYQLNTSYGAVVVPSDASAQPIPGDSLLINAKSKQVIQVINVPLIFKYQVVKNKFSFYSEVGLSANFILSQKLSIDYFGKEKIISEVRGLKKFYPGATIGLGVSYAINNKVQLFLEPNLRAALTPINKYNSKEAYPYTLGLFAGLLFHF